MAPGFPKRFHKVWMYRVLGLLTIVYIILQLIQFYCQFKDPPCEFRWFWMVSLLGYVLLKEVFRWNDVEESTARWGEVYVILVIGSFLLMQGVNIVRLWAYGMPNLVLPDGALEGALEALVLWVGSTISAATHHSKRNNNNSGNNSNKTKSGEGVDDGT